MHYSLSGIVSHVHVIRLHFAVTLLLIRTCLPTMLPAIIQTLLLSLASPTNVHLPLDFYLCSFPKIR